MNIIEYDRIQAVSYARKWAFSRNPAYYNFNRLGGDCTNFASQCLFAGVGVMNFTPDLGWYYLSLNDRAAAWTGVEYFYNFLIGNRVGVGDGYGPFAEDCGLDGLEIGDFIQLGNETGEFLSHARHRRISGQNPPRSGTFLRRVRETAFRLSV